MTDDDEGRLPPRSRFTRFRKLAALGARMGSDAVAQGVRRLASGEQSVLSKAAAEKLVSVLGEMKGVAMKVGQVIALDDQFLTPEIRAVIARLHNEAPPMPFATVAEMIERELGASPDTLFASFDRQPFAAASLGQVHRATLGDGRVVAVKVQYPGIDEALGSDLDNMGTVVRAIGMTHRALDAGAYYGDLRAQLEREVDYRIEAEHCERFRRAVTGLPELIVPEVLRELSARRVLTQQFVDGVTLKEFVTGEHSAEKKYEVARLMIRAIYAPFLTHGVLQGDPHPGNFLVRADGKLGLLDFGAVKQQTPVFVQVNREALAHALDAAPFDAVEASRRAGFQITLRDEQARPLIEEIFTIVGRSLRDADYDFRDDQVVYELKKLFAKNAPRLLKIRPPVEAMGFFRATAILAQDLRLIGARGDFARVYRELLELPAYSG